MSVTSESCNVCNQTEVYTAGIIYCLNCHNTKYAYYHSLCLINGPFIQSTDCRYCTSDKKRMYVYDFYKVQYIVRHYAISKEEYDEIINRLYIRFTLSGKLVNRSYFDYEKIIMNNPSELFQYGNYWYCVYLFLMDKYKITKNIEEAIKDQLYRSRTGFFTKCATKK